MPGLGLHIGLAFSRGTPAPAVELTIVPPAIFEKVPATITAVTVPADAVVTMTVNGEAWGAPTAAVGGVCAITATPTAAMLSATAAVTASITGATATAGVTDAWGPARLGAKATHQWDETTTFDAGGWVGKIGGVTLTSAALPTTGTHGSRRSLVCNGSSQFVKAAFARAQPCSTYLFGAFTGVVPAANAALFSGDATSGAMLRLNTNATAMRITAGTNVACTATADVQNRWAVWSALFSGASSVGRENGTQIGAGNANTGAPAGISLGAHGSGASFCACAFTEVILCDGTETAPEIAKLIAYGTAVLGS